LRRRAGPGRGPHARARRGEAHRGSLPDIQAALQWHLDRGETSAGCQLANALVTVWLGTNRIPDGDAWFSRLLAPPGEADATRALALHQQGYLVFWGGEHDRAAERFRESLDLAASLDDASLQALALAGLARVALYSDASEAVRLLRKALEGSGSRSATAHVSRTATNWPLTPGWPP